MQASSGNLLSNEEYEKLDAQAKKDFHPIPDDTKVDTIHKLQKKMSTAARRAALKSLNRNNNKVKTHTQIEMEQKLKRREKNKQAKAARKANRKK